MHIEEVYIYDVILVKFPSKEKAIPCRVISINTDNVITVAFLEDGLEKISRVEDEWIKGVEAYEHRDPNGRRVIVYCKD